MLTELGVRNAKAGDKDYKLSDSEGLYLFVSKAGHRSWRLKYRFAGKERRLILGAYAWRRPYSPDHAGKPDRGHQPPGPGSGGKL